MIYLPGWELVVLAVMSLSGTTYGNFGSINPFIPPLGTALTHSGLPKTKRLDCCTVVVYTPRLSTK